MHDVPLPLFAGIIVGVSIMMTEMRPLPRAVCTAARMPDSLTPSTKPTAPMPKPAMVLASSVSVPP